MKWRHLLIVMVLVSLLLSIPASASVDFVASTLKSSTYRDVEVVGRYVYAALSYGLDILDVSDPTHPLPVGSYDNSGRAYAVAVSGDYVYIAGDTGLVVLDVSDPANPKRVGEHDTPPGVTLWYSI